ncbi:hypothetical protein A6046_01055 [[Haemophilus] ducreyi]|nr:hypothetical protein [[Haemophilus] ducreyi]AKO30846.1 hypothetical protein RY60_03655 [[Haemophilus] ducreyi]AKO32284.1 hypothetical protein RZ57_03660 [[Haemophilus] ducreyi]AKO33738.1 hypothetical protein RZ58_03675 [[Haemophilus] ducreyi]AKO35186.1 hypothetical protein RZ59_03640 [[Haemophilus] ducreyi]AKO36618.1 hypothetical protein RZ61_03680 [[Haemophilus] ducreyi]
MKKLVTITLMLGVSMATYAAPIMTQDEAHKVVEASIYKNKLTKLSKDCIKYGMSEEAGEYLVDIYEVHNKKCGGDPSVQNRLFSYSVDKKSGALATDAMHDGVDWDGDLHPIQ